MGNEAYQSPAWLLEGLIGSSYGSLELRGRRLTFTVDERRVFDVSLSDLYDVTFPWYYFGGGVKFRIGAEKYRISFVEPGNRSDMTDVVGGRDNGRIWRKLLTTSST